MCAYQLTHMHISVLIYHLTHNHTSISIYPSTYHISIHLSLSIIYICLSLSIYLSVYHLSIFVYLSIENHEFMLITQIPIQHHGTHFTFYVSLFITSFPTERKLISLSTHLNMGWHRIHYISAREWGGGVLFGLLEMKHRNVPYCYALNWSPKVHVLETCSLTQCLEVGPSGSHLPNLGF
jgi:hypothetical protein